MSEQQDIQVSLNSIGRVFEGIGGITSNGMSKLMMDYPEPIRRDLMRLLFEPNFGASLQHLKVEIGSDVNTSSGTEPSHMRGGSDFDIKRGYGLEIMREAKQINPALLLDSLRWGTPAWIKNDEDKFQYYLGFLKGARENFGIEFDYLGPDINEGHFDRDWVVNTLRPGLDANGFKNLLIVADDSDQGWGIADQIVDDPALDEIVHALCVHYRQDSTDNARSSNKPLWLSEDLASFRHSYKDGALDIGLRIIRMYADGKMVKYEIHPLIEAMYENTPFNYKGILVASWPWSGHYRIDAGLWVIAHFTQFIKPGWQYIDSACGFDQDSGYVGLTDPSGKDYSMVFVNKRKTEQSYRLQTEVAADSEVHVWVTTEFEHFRKMLTLKPTDGFIEIVVPPLAICTVTTTSGQTKGQPGVSIQAETQFELPYVDDFSSYAIGQMPKYTSDQGGAFEIVNKDGQALLEQKIVLDRKPLDWTYRQTPEPYTLLGSLEWKNYEVSVEACLPDGEGCIRLGGRINCTDKSDAQPGGYMLQLSHNGHWQLAVVGLILAEGSVSGLTLTQWQILTLRFSADCIEARLNGSELVQVRDSLVPSGHIVLGSGYNRAWFRNLHMNPLPDHPVSCVRYDDRDQQITFGGRWSNEDGDYNTIARTLKHSVYRNDRMSFRFNGTSVSVVGKKTPNGGLADVFIDRLLIATIDTWSAAVSFRKSIFTKHDLPAGDHLLELIVRGEGVRDTAHRSVYIDAIEVTGFRA
jgi:galactosylceramidase